MYMASRISKMIRDTNKFLRSRTAIKEMKIRYFVGLYSTVDHLFVAQLCFIVCKVFLFTFTYAQYWLWSRALRYLLEESSGAHRTFLLAALCLGGGVYLETKLIQNLLFASNTVPRARYSLCLARSPFKVISNCLYHIWDRSPKAELQLT